MLDINQALYLIIIPHAGAGVDSYNFLISQLPENIIPIPIELPGHGRRRKERLKTSTLDIINDLYEQVKNILNFRYILLGHSMGAFLSYYLALKIVENKKQQPSRLFLSACNPPGYITSKYYLLEKIELRNKLRDMGLFNSDLLSNRLLFSYFEPLIRADFGLVEGCDINQTEILNIPFTILRGRNDPISDKTHMWNIFTNSVSHLYTFDGGHFYMEENISKVIKLLINEI